ncbi:MAG: RNA polymerase sigma factor [Thermoanaerobaculales bacterium]|nr:RNA polymerase sigma factor [Thermoanaerobaculales bacterium]
MRGWCVWSIVEAVTDEMPPISVEDARAPRRADEDWQGLFNQLAAGRLAALDELYDAAAPSLYGLALWRTGSKEDAADVVQDVFLRVAEQGARLAKVRNPRAWLLTVARRAAVDVTRRRSRRAADSLDDFPFLTAADDHGERLLDAAQVSVLLSALPESFREVIYLKHFVGCTFAEIGEVVGVPKFTAASRYRNGIQKLRKLMEGDHEAQ